MEHRNGRWTSALLVSAVLCLLAIPQAWAAGGKSLGKDSGVVPATLESIPNSDIKRVKLTERAAERIDLQTGKVGEVMLRGAMRQVVPYASIIYDPHGGTWVYTNPSGLTFERAPIEVDFIEGDHVAIRSGPPVGTTVATLGVAELYGTEFEVGH